MTPERRQELLAYAAACFEHCTNPFEYVHLVQKKVTADECKDLSQDIASILEDEIVACITLDRSSFSLSNLKSRARLEFEETQR